MTNQRVDKVLSHLAISPNTQRTFDSVPVTQKQSDNGNLQSSSTSDLLVRKFWKMAMEIYQSKWVATNGSRASELWYALISKCGEQGCLRILERCRDDIRHGREWPPTAVEAELMLNTRSKTEVQQAFMRWEVGEPKGRAEKWVSQKYTWNLRRTPVGREYFEYEKHLRLADELERNGKLQLAEEELAMLPVNSTVHITDVEREQYARSGKAHAFTDRINALRRMKRD